MRDDRQPPRVLEETVLFRFEQTDGIAFSTVARVTEKVSQKKILCQRSWS